MELAQALASYPGAVAFRFGDRPALNAKILAPVRDGRKTVSCDAVAGFAPGIEMVVERFRMVEVFE